MRIARREHLAITCSAQVVVYLDTLFAVLDVRRIELGSVELGRTPRRVEHHISRNRRAVRQMHVVASCAPLNRLRLDAFVNGEPELLEMCHEVRHEVCVAAFQRFAAPHQHVNLAAEPRVDMAEFEGDGAAADDREPIGDAAELEDIVRRRHMLRAEEGELPRCRPGCDQGMVESNDAVFDFEPAGRHKAHSRLDVIDAGLAQTVLRALRDRISKPVFTIYDRIPVDLDFASRDAVLARCLHDVQHFGRADQHLFGIASAQRAKPADRRRIDQRHFFSCGFDLLAGGQSGIAATQGDEVVVIHGHR